LLEHNFIPFINYNESRFPEFIKNAPTVEQIIDQLKTLTLIESSELVTQTKHSVCLHRKCAARNGPRLEQP
jgi:hypothetical protein